MTPDSIQRIRDLNAEAFEALSTGRRAAAEKQEPIEVVNALLDGIMAAIGILARQLDEIKGAM